MKLQLQAGEPQSNGIPNSLIEKLKSLAQQKSWNDIINGQSDLAKEILKELDISWDK